MMTIIQLYSAQDWRADVDPEVKTGRGGELSADIRAATRKGQQPP